MLDHVVLGVLPQADLLGLVSIYSYITMPMETFWRLIIGVRYIFLSNMITRSCNILCKGLMMVRTGGYILSSLLLAVLSIDRCVVQT